MGVRVAVLIALVALLAPLSATSQAQVGTLGSTAIGLGYGPLSIEPASVGSPIYTVGDQVWIQSYVQSEVFFVTLKAPNGTVGPNFLLNPGALLRLHTFAPSDPSGEWTVDTTASSTGVASNYAVTLAAPAAPLVPQFVGGNLTNNGLNLGFRLTASQAYDVQACSMGSVEDPSATFQLPPDIGGFLKVTMEGGALTILAPTPAAEFSTWFEMYAARGFSSGNSIVSQLSLAAQTGTFVLGPSNKGAIAEVSDNLFLRSGRYEMRAFVRDSTGLFAFSGQFLKTNATGWVSLGGCTQLSDVQGTSFTMKSDLDNANTTWPRSLYTMYEEGGIDRFTQSKVSTTEARIDVRSATQIRRIAGSAITVSGAGIQSWAAFDSGIYMIGTKYPFSASVKVNYDGIATGSYNVTVPRPFSSVPLLVPVGDLEVQATSQGQPLANATVGVSGGTRGPTDFKTGAQGSASFTLPPGDYGVTVTKGGMTASTVVQVTSGGAAVANLDLSSQSYPVTQYALAAILVIGGAINFVVWRAYLERRATYR